jgi:hypothetical protein
MLIYVAEMSRLSSSELYQMMKNVVFGMLRRVALVRTDVYEEFSASIIRVTGIGELEQR